MATLRFGMNTFEDDNSLPYDFDPATLGFAPSFVTAMPVKKFPSVTTTGYQGTGFSGVNNRNYYTYGGNGTITKLIGGHSYKVGADYRILGVKAENFGQSSGSFTFNGQFTAANPTVNVRNAIADLMLGVPSAGTFAQNSPVNNFVKYYSAYFQDDWRVSDKLTLNYGVRLEKESGLAEADNKLVVGFDKDAISPLAVTIPADPVAGTPARQVTGGLIYAGENGAKETTGNPPAIKFSPRVGMAYSMNHEDGGARRLRIVLGAVGLRREQLGRLFGDDEHGAAEQHSGDRHRRSVPVGPDSDLRQFARAAVGRQLRHQLRRSEQDRAVRAPVFDRRAARAGRQPERQRRLHRIDRPPADHGRQRQHQPGRSEVPAARQRR